MIEFENTRPVLQTGRVKLTKTFILPLIAIAIAAICAGCEKAGTKSENSPGATNASASAGYWIPSGPQPKLPTMKIYLAQMLGKGPTNTLDAEIALTPEQQATGLMYRTNITDETAMLFVLPEQTHASFWMTNCPVSESAAYIGPDGVIEEIHHFEKNDNVPVVAAHGNIYYVLEVNDGWFARHNIFSGTQISTERGSLDDTFRK